MIISQAGIDLIKSFEGLSLTAYKAVPTEKNWTIGYGHCGSDVKQGEVITQADAEAILKVDLRKFENVVNSFVKVSINQYQFDALVSFTYNCGVEALRTSDLLMKLNNGDVTGCANEFDRWIHAAGKVLNGLVKRRKQEKELFLKAYVTPANNVNNSPSLSTYKVKSGDTLSKIAVQYGTSVNDLLRVNPQIKNKNLIYPNDILNLPGRQKTVTTQTYTIRSGENLTKIGQRFNTSVDELMKLNPSIKNKNLIYAGQTIKVPK